MDALGLALTLTKDIYKLVEEVQVGKQQLDALATCVTQLLNSLDAQLRSGRLKETQVATALEDLNSLLEEIVLFVRKQRKIGFIKLIIIKDERKSAIESFHKQISACVSAFNIVSLIDIQRWNIKHEEARQEDRRILNETLRRLEAHSNALEEVIAKEGQSPLAIMTTLEKMIEKGKSRNTNPEETKFFSKSLQHLKAISQQQVDVLPWTVTAVEVEFGPLIGTGGFGKVYHGRWNQREVALKVMKNKEDISPHATHINSEVETWSRLKHPHILEFLGANILDDNPFIVMPYLKNGNARHHLSQNPTTDRNKLAHEISLGLTYLHNEASIVHGDLKALNVLIDDGGKAVLCDFGLSRMKQDMMSRSTMGKSDAIVGSQNWMAPELFNGGSLRRPCDIYSFAMTLYEIFTLEIPFGLVTGLIPEIVVRNRQRPDRPLPEDATQMTDAVWGLMEQCWAHEPHDRPKASAVSQRLSALVERSNLSPSWTNRKNSISSLPPSPLRARSDSSGSQLNGTSSGSSPQLVAPPNSSNSTSPRLSMLYGERNRAESLLSIPEWSLPPVIGAGELATTFIRPASTKFNRWITKGSKYEPEAGRYRLYVSYACPWSLQTLIARNMKQLDKTISVKVLAPVVDDFGWSFLPAGDSAESGPLRLRDLYLIETPQYDGSATLPVLWDKKTNTIVSNDAQEIVRLFSDAFNDLLPAKSRPLDFYPSDERIRNRVGEWNKYIDRAFEAVYRAGYADSQADHDAAVKQVFTFLGRVEKQFHNTKGFLVNQISEADLRLWNFLLPFDAVYAILFKCNLKTIRMDYPYIHDFLRDLYWRFPAFKEVTQFEHIKAHYYLSHQTLNPKRVIPSGPEHFILPLDAKHNPEKMLTRLLL